jgi:hypothetical protein
MSRRFQFSLKRLLCRMFLIAAVAVPIGYLLRLPTQVLATGTVTLDGVPLSGASVWFVEGDAQVGPCTTDTAGQFAISLFPGSIRSK